MPYGGAGRLISVFCSSCLVFRVAVFHISGFFITSSSPSSRVPAFHISGLHVLLPNSPSSRVSASRISGSRVLLLNILKPESSTLRPRDPYFGSSGPVTRTGSLNNDDGDVNEHGKKAKQQLCTCITFFCTFLSRHCTCGRNA